MENSNSPDTISSDFDGINNLISGSEKYGNNHGFFAELHHLKDIIQSIWPLMDKTARQKFHKSEEVFEYAYFGDEDKVPEFPLSEPDEYFYLMWENREDCDPEYMAGDLQEWIYICWKCLSSDEQNKFLSLPRMKILGKLHSSIKASG